MIILKQYPTLTKENAQHCLTLYTKGELTPQIIGSKTTGAFTERSNTQAVEETISRLWEIVEEVELDGGRNAQAFHSKASVELHKGFVNLGAATRDPNFWRWVTFFPNAEGAALIDLRYGNSNIPGSATDDYYKGRISQGLLSTLWLRAEITHDPEHSEDPYYLCQAKDDIEFWWSHIIRINFSSCRALARAFVKFVAESKMPRGDTKNMQEEPGFRDLAPELKRRFATISFETMDENDAYRFIENVWADRHSWRTIN